MEMVVSRLSEPFDKDFLERVVHSLKNWLPAKQVHRLDLDIYNALSEKLMEKWIFNLDYFPADKQVQNSTSDIPSIFKDIETKTQLCMLPLGDELTYDISFKVDGDVLQCLEPATEPCLEPCLESESDFTEVQFASIRTGSHCLSQSCFSLM